MARTDACHDLIRRAANRIRQEDDRLLAGVLASTNRHTEFCDSPHVLGTLRTSTLRLRLLAASALRVLTKTPGLPPVLLDEFGALGGRAVPSSSWFAITEGSRTALFTLDSTRV